MEGNIASDAPESLAYETENRGEPWQWCPSVGTWLLRSCNKDTAEIAPEKAAAGEDLQPFFTEENSDEVQLKADVMTNVEEERNRQEPAVEQVVDVPIPQQVKNDMVTANCPMNEDVVTDEMYYAKWHARLIQLDGEADAAIEAANAMYTQTSDGLAWSSALRRLLTNVRTTLR